MTQPDMINALCHLIRRKFADLLDEVMASDDPSFTTEQVELLEKRFFEIGQDIADASLPNTNP